MNILHVWDQAGVGCIIAKYQQNAGHQSTVMKIKDQDPYGINRFYNRYMLNVKSEEFIEACLQNAQNADIIHIHSRLDVLFAIRKKFKKSKKVILHYHGTDIRGVNRQTSATEGANDRNNNTNGLFTGKVVSNLLRPEATAKLISRSKTLVKLITGSAVSKRKLHLQAQSLSDAVIVSTPDLLRLVPAATYLPNPIDTDHFKPDKPKNGNLKDALTINTEVTDIQWALQHCKDNNINLDIDVYDRTRDPILYSDIPNFLKKYRIYVDIRYVNNSVLDNLSKTALEALACGLKVLDYNLQYQEGLPQQHQPVTVTEKLFAIYKK